MIGELAHRLVNRTISRSKGKSKVSQQADNDAIKAGLADGVPLTQELSEITRPQTQSRFLHRLPLDVRLLIYSYIFPRDVDTVHVQWRYPWILPQGLRKGNGLGKWYQSKCGIRIWLNSDKTGRPQCGFCLPTWREPPRIPLDIALLFVCRQIYSEAIYVFYSSLTLQLYSGPSLGKFITAVPPQYLALVPNLWFDWCLGGKELPHTSPSAKLAYDKVWEDLRSFSGLRVLCATLESRMDHRPLPLNMQIEKVWLPPLDQFSNLERCDVTVGADFRGVFQHMKKESPWRVLKVTRTLNRSTGKPYRSCRSCGTTHGSVQNNSEWVGGNG